MLKPMNATTTMFASNVSRSGFSNTANMVINTAEARYSCRLGKLVFAAGLVGPAIVLLSLGWRYGLGLDAPWYLIDLVVVGYVKTIPVVIVLAGAAGAAQLAVAAAGRYAAYPDARERRPRGPLRELVRVLVLGARSRRRRRQARLRAVGS